LRIWACRSPTRRRCLRRISFLPRRRLALFENIDAFLISPEGEAEASTAAENKDVTAARYGLNNHDNDAARMILWPRIVLHPNPMVLNAVREPQGSKNCATRVHTAIPDAYHLIDHLLGQNDLVVIHPSLQGTLSTRFARIPLTGVYQRRVVNSLARKCGGRQKSRGSLVVVWTASTSNSSWASCRPDRWGSSANRAPRSRRPAVIVLRVWLNFERGAWT